ncbi:MAG: Uma2 family endonuclease [Albidovulum sp.]|nr:Uma2 family endonuclease [Albidovulum sp.]
MDETLARHRCVGPMGSEFWRIEVPPEIVPALAEKLDWNRMGRRVMIDAAKGIISWMSPSSAHATFADAADETVKAAGRQLGVRTRAMRDTRWKRPEDPENTGLEADASFYIGKNAESWYAARRRDGAAATEAFEASMPPDLAVEVEVTRFDGNKPGRYAALGVREMWRAASRDGGNRVEVEILDLRAPGGPRPAEESAALPGLKAALLPKAFDLAAGGRFEELEELLAAALAQAPAPRRDPDDSPSPV